MSLLNVGVGFAGGAWAAPTILVAATATSRRAGITSLGTEPIGFSFINNSHFKLEGCPPSTYGLSVAVHVARISYTSSAMATGLSNNRRISDRSWAPSTPSIAL